MAFRDDKTVPTELMGNQFVQILDVTVMCSELKLGRFNDWLKHEKSDDRQENEYLSRNWGRCWEQSIASTWAEWRKGGHSNLLATLFGMTDLAMALPMRFWENFCSTDSFEGMFFLIVDLHRNAHDYYGKSQWLTPVLIGWSLKAAVA